MIRNQRNWILKFWKWFASYNQDFKNFSPMHFEMWVTTSQIHHLPSLIKVILIVATKDRHILQRAGSLNNKISAQVVFQELEVRGV